MSTTLQADTDVVDFDCIIVFVIGVPNHTTCTVPVPIPVNVKVLVLSRIASILMLPGVEEKEERLPLLLLPWS